jgi:hypothetical protein
LTLVLLPCTAVLLFFALKQWTWADLFNDVVVFFVLLSLAVGAHILIWRLGRKITIHGEARAIQLRSERRTILSFRLDRFDDTGNRLTPIYVEMRGLTLEGVPTEGDLVEMRARWREGKIVRVSRAVNLTTHSPIVAKGDLAAGCVQGIILLVVVLPPLLLIFFLLKNRYSK